MRNGFLSWMNSLEGEVLQQTFAHSYIAGHAKSAGASGPLWSRPVCAFLLAQATELIYGAGVAKGLFFSTM